MARKGLITTEELSESLLSLIYGSGVGGRLGFFRNSIEIEESTNTIPIGINGYNKNTDLLMVYVNTTYIEVNIEYTIDEGSLNIIKIDGDWIPINTPMQFNFIVLKNVGPDNNISTIGYLKNNVEITTSVTDVTIGIADYDKNTDMLMVFNNSVYIEVDNEYTISSDSTKIHKIEGDWDGSQDTQQFDFIVLKNVTKITDISVVPAGSIDISKLDSDLQTKIVLIDEHESTLQDTKKIINNSLTNTVRDMIGISVHTMNDTLSAKIKTCGFKYIRIDLTWSSIETQEGIYNFSSYDNINGQIITNNFIPYYILDYNNDLYGLENNITTTTMRNAFKNFVSACADHFKNQGCIFEIYNEPNHSGFWSPQLTTTPLDYVNVASDVYSIIHQNDSTATVATPALSGTDADWFEKTCINGLLNYTDIITIHPYTNNNPETKIINYKIFQSIIGKYSNRIIPLWAGEVGYSTVSNWNGSGNNAITSANNQGPYLVRFILSGILFGIPTIIYTALDGVGDNTNVETYFGIFNPDYSDKQSASFIKSIITPILDYTFVELMPSSPTNYILKFANYDTNKIAYIAWTDSGATKYEIIDNKQVTLTGVPQLIYNSTNGIKLVTRGELLYEIQKLKSIAHYENAKYRGIYYTAYQNSTGQALVSGVNTNLTFKTILSKSFFITTTDYTMFSPQLNGLYTIVIQLFFDDSTSNKQLQIYTSLMDDSSVNVVYTCTFTESSKIINVHFSTSAPIKLYFKLYHTKGSNINLTSSPGLRPKICIKQEDINFRQDYDIIDRSLY